MVLIVGKGANQGTKKEAFLIEPRQNRVIACEDLDFTWDSPELKEIAKMWKAGIGVKRIAANFERDPDEVLIALIHLARAEKIEKRIEGLLI